METSNNRIRVLIVAGRMDVGGIENQLMHLLRNVDPAKYRMDYTTTDQHPFYEDEILALGGGCIHIPGAEGRHFFRYCKALFRVMKDGQYDVVHSNELFHSGMVLLVARLAGVKVRIAHAHSSNQLPGRGMVRRFYTAVMHRLILRCATHFVACSTLAAEFLYGKQILNKPNYHLIVNSVETARFLPMDEAKTEESVNGGWKTVLQVGRFCDEKNFPFSARIAAECKRRGDRIRFRFVGNDGQNNPYEHEVRRIIEEEDLEDCVELLGVRKDVSELMRQADAFLLPSKFEGMPLTLIEAQAAGLPCVAADTFSHEVDFGLNAIRWMPLSAPAAEWAEAINQAVHCSKLPRRVLADAIQKHGFDVSCFAAHISELYAEAD